MCTHNFDENDPAAMRAAVRRLIKRYPDISEDELETVLGYLRDDALATDIDLLKSELGHLPQYQQLCSDHYLWRLRPAEKLLVVVAGLGIVLILWLLKLLADTI